MNGKRSHKEMEENHVQISGMYILKELSILWDGVKPHLTYNIETNGGNKLLVILDQYIFL